MTKAKVDYSGVTPDLVAKVREVIADADKHVYSVSKVYAAYNAAFSLNETPQTCSSCLRNRANALREWLKGYDDTRDVNAPELPAPGVIRIPLVEGTLLDFVPSTDDPTKGTVKWPDGSNVAPGKYAAERGETVIVQVGGKARIEAEDLT